MKGKRRGRERGVFLRERRRPFDSKPRHLCGDSTLQGCPAAAFQRNPAKSPLRGRQRPPGSPLSLPAGGVSWARCWRLQAQCRLIPNPPLRGLRRDTWWHVPHLLSPNRVSTPGPAWSLAGTRCP